MKILIAGGSGFIGSALKQALLFEGHEVLILTRNKSRIDQKTNYYWNPQTREIDKTALENTDVIINLAGENIAGGLWTRKRKKKILESRINATSLLVDLIIQDKSTKLKHFISASASGYYGNRPSEILNETSYSGSGFLPNVCSEWERAATELNKPGITLSVLRIGIILSDKGGFLKKLNNITKFRINIIPGNGKQKISWIHLDDFVRIVLFIVNNKHQGIFNCSSPVPCQLKDLQNKVFRKYKLPFLTFHIHTRILKLFLGEFSELFLNDQNILPRHLMDLGFLFQYNKIEHINKNPG